MVLFLRVWFYLKHVKRMLSLIYSANYHLQLADDGSLSEDEADAQYEVYLDYVSMLAQLIVSDAGGRVSADNARAMALYKRDELQAKCEALLAKA